MSRTNRYPAFLLVVILILSTTFANAQTDFGLWGGFELSKKVSDDLRFGFKGNLRFDDNASSYRLSYLQLSLQYRPYKWMRASLGSRAVWRDKFNANGDRLFANMTFIRKWHKRLRTRYRLQYQLDRDTNTEWAMAENGVRHKLSTSWRKKKTDFTWNFGTEFFYSWDGRGGDWDKYRLFFGTSYQINKRQTIGIDYIFQSELNSGNDKINIIALEYSLQLK